jgi:hypothetical protein
LKALQARKRDLLLESELNRQVLRVEISNLTVEAERLRRGYGWVQSAWAWGAPLAGFLMARKQGKGTGVFSKGSLLFGALRAGWKTWTVLREMRAGSRQEETPPQARP